MPPFFKKSLSLLKTFLIAGLLFACSKSNEAQVVPSVSIQDAVQVRSTTDGVMRFYVNANVKTSKEVSVDYTVVAGTAKSPADIVSASGTLTIPANETQTSVDVQIKGDPTNLRQSNLQFSVVLSNPKSCTLGTSTATGTLVTENGSYLPTDNAGYTTPKSYANYTLVWSDEFSGTSLDQSAWNTEIGNGSGGWGNNELEYYTGSTNNVFVSNGNLIIEARKELVSGFNYTSSRLTTAGKKVFKFGRIDIRAKIPVGKGIWPALWMLGTNIGSVGWPACGEIDIMELIGTSPKTVYGTMHWKGTNGNATQNGLNGDNHQYDLPAGDDYSKEFHVFSMVWKQDSIQMYVDDNLYLSFSNQGNVAPANYPFNAEEFFIFNVAVGGNWPGPPDASTVFPQRMFVDYVRVFQ